MACYAAPVYPFQPAGVERWTLAKSTTTWQAKYSLISLSCSRGAHGSTLFLYPVLPTDLHVE
jgi:hypothetical protein